jgi:hypothetical protein
MRKLDEKMTKKYVALNVVFVVIWVLLLVFAPPLIVLPLVYGIAGWKMGELICIVSRRLLGIPNDIKDE